MKITICNKTGAKLSFDTENISQYKVSTDVFQMFEDLWEDWFEQEKEHNSEIEDMYYSEEACFYKKGAVMGAIETFAEIAEETPRKHFYSFKEVQNTDYECAFN